MNTNGNRYYGVRVEGAKYGVSFGPSCSYRQMRCSGAVRPQIVLIRRNQQRRIDENDGSTGARHQADQRHEQVGIHWSLFSLGRPQ
jgi:hypothetical protein